MKPLIEVGKPGQNIWYGNINRALIFAILITTLTMTALSQTQNQPENTPVCNLSVAQAPVIRGIGLGMKPDEWLKLFPGSPQNEQIKTIIDQPPMYPDYGQKAFNLIAPNANLSIGGRSVSIRTQFSEELSGIDAVSFKLFDNQIIWFRVYYHGSDINPWDSIDQLFPIFSKTYNLPEASVWDKRGNAAKLNCAGFELDLFSGNGPLVELKSRIDPRATIDQRREADRLKARAAFKP